MKPGWGLVVLAGLGGIAVGTWAFRAADSSCCERFNNAARDKIAGYFGPFSDLVSGALDATGGTKLIAGVLDDLGIPKG